MTEVLIAPVRRFWSKVGPPDKDGCRPWLGCKLRDRRGLFKVGGRRGRNVTAPGFAWRETYHGPVHPNAADFAHSCDRPWCCEPAHVYPTTHAKNIEQRQARGRQAKGERMGGAKLTEDDVREIRASTDSQRVTAARFGIDRTNVHKIVTRKSWGWLA